MQVLLRVVLQVLDALYSSIHRHAVEHYAAFYSSELHGIVTDPGLMVVHMDDHLVHRGHAVFDTAIIVDGYLYQLAEHLARFEQSAEMAGLVLPFSIEQIFRIIRETAAASKAVNGGFISFLALQTAARSVHHCCYAAFCCLYCATYYSAFLSSVVCPEFLQHLIHFDGMCTLPIMYGDLQNAYQLAG